MTTGRGRLPIEVVLDTAEAERQLEELQQTAQAGVGEGSAGQPGLTAQVSGYGDAVRSTILPSIAAAAATIASVTALSRWVDSTIQASIAMGVATEGAVALRNSQLLLERAQAGANVALLDSLGILDLWRERNERIAERLVELTATLEDPDASGWEQAAAGAEILLTRFNQFFENLPGVDILIGVNDALAASLREVFEGIELPDLDFDRGLEGFLTNVIPSWARRGWESLRPFLSNLVPGWVKEGWEALEDFFKDITPSWVIDGWDAVRTFFNETVPGWIEAMVDAAIGIYNSIPFLPDVGRSSTRRQTPAPTGGADHPSGGGGVSLAGAEIVTRTDRDAQVIRTVRDAQRRGDLITGGN